MSDLKTLGSRCRRNSRWLAFNWKDLAHWISLFSFLCSFLLNHSVYWWSELSVRTFLPLSLLFSHIVPSTSFFVWCIISFSLLPFSSDRLVPAGSKVYRFRGCQLILLTFYFQFSRWSSPFRENPKNNLINRMFLRLGNFLCFEALK